MHTDKINCLLLYTFNNHIVYYIVFVIANKYENCNNCDFLRDYGIGNEILMWTRLFSDKFWAIKLSELQMS